MKKKTNIFNMLWAILLMFLFIPILYCALEPPVAPKWETTLTLPLISKTFHMDEIVDDEDNLRADSSGHVYFDFSKDIDRYTVGDKLQMDGFGHSFETRVGAYQIQSLEDKQVEFSLNELYSEAETLHGNTVIIPEFQLTDVQKPLPVFEEFAWTLVDTGTVFLELTNNLPFWLGPDLVLRLMDSQADSLIDEVPLNREIAPGETVKKSINASGKKFTNQLQFLLTGNSQGSKGDAVEIDAFSTISLETRFSAFTVQEAVAKTPAVKISETQTVAIDDSISINIAVVQDGKLRLDLINQVPVAGKIVYELSDFYKDSEPYTDSLYIAAKTHSQISIPLQNLVLQPDYAEVGEQSVKFKWTFITEESDELVHLRSSDVVQADLSSSDIVFSEINGILNEIEIDINPFAEDLNFSDELDSVRLAYAIIRLNIENTINLPARSDIVIRGTNDAGHSVDLEVREEIFAAPEDGSKMTTIILDKNNSNVVDFLNTLPKKIEMSGSVWLGDRNSPGTVTQSDYIEGNMNITAPLSLSFPTQTATTDIDTLEIDEDNRDTIRDRLMSGEVVAKISNMLPFGAVVEAKFSTHDSSVFSNPGLVIGPLNISPATIDESGFASASSENELNVTLTKEDLRFFENSTIFSGIEITFPGSNGTAVNVMTSDFIKVQMYSVFKLVVSADDNN